jgi:hypothetical protein
MVATLSTSGCQTGGFKASFAPAATAPPGSLSQLKPSSAVESECTAPYVELLSPFDLDEQTLTPEKLRGMSLQECIAMGLNYSRVMRDLGVTAIRFPESVRTNLDPAIVFADPRIGEEAALSEFDANMFASSFYESNDRRFNNQFFGQNGFFLQDLSTNQIGISKRSATGASFTVRDVTVYDRNNQQANKFGNPATQQSFSWDNFLEATARQPLLLGSGTEFNRIAGPNAQPGELNGVLLARVRTDVSLIDFERAVRDFVADIENAYWDLYYAYRDLDARIDARDIAQYTADRVIARESGLERIEQANEQVIRFQAEVVDALNGRPIDGTRTNNGSSGGTFRGIGGVRVCERKLRLMVGLPINDGVLIQPIDRPTLAPVVFDWSASIEEALRLREELRRQRWVVKQRELELIANRNFLKPQFDAVSAYRLRGFGQNLTSPFNGDLQEWSLGLDYQMPVGFRRGNAAVRNSQLELARASELLREQERSIHFGLSNAVNDTKRAYDNLLLQRQRLEAITRQLAAMSAKQETAELPELDILLETHRRLLDARLRYHTAEVEYELSLRNVHLEKGSLLRYCNVWLNESIADTSAIARAERRTSAQDYFKVPHHRDVIVGRPGP